MMIGYACEDCGEVVWPAAPPGEIRWLRDRRHIVREVAGHLHSGLDSWMAEGLAFLDEHGDHSIAYIERP
jgi:hypothetical protein